MEARGFTLVELMIVVVIIAVIAVIALPNLLSARLSANETTAIATLRAIAAAQAQFQTRGLADGDNDGLGEHGMIAEMAGGVGVRGGKLLKPAVLSSGFRYINASGEAVRHGYQYRMFLPSVLGVGLGELAGGGAPAGVDDDLAETTWCCYAWPTDYEQSGRRTFFLNQAGELIFADSASYSGPGTGPLPGAAMKQGGDASYLTGTMATGATGRDGNLWRAVQE